MTKQMLLLSILLGFSACSTEEPGEKENNQREETQNQSDNPDPSIPDQNPDFGPSNPGSTGGAGRSSSGSGCGFAFEDGSEEEALAIQELQGNWEPIDSFRSELFGGEVTYYKAFFTFDMNKEEAGYLKVYYASLTGGPYGRASFDGSFASLSIGKTVKDGDYAGFTVFEVQNDTDSTACQTFAYRFDGEERIELLSGSYSYVEGGAKPDVAEFFAKANRQTFARYDGALPSLLPGR